MFHPHALPTAKGRCGCGAPVDGGSFRDRRSYREFHLSGFCQACQDTVFLGMSDVEPLKYALRRGAVAACTERDGVRELAILPFVFTAPRGPLEWEARYATRVAPAGAASVDPCTELRAMEPALRLHQIRLHLAASPVDPLLARTFLQCELLVGHDIPSLARVAALCPAFANAAPAPIAATFERQYGAPVASLGEVVASYHLDSPEPAPSALRLCAWIAAFLDGPFPGAPPLFPDVLLSRPDVVAQCPPWRMDAEPRPRWVSDRPRWRGYVE